MQHRSSRTVIPVRVGCRQRIDDICRFRARVWQATAGVAANAFPDGTWRDDYDDAAMHWIVRDEQGQILGAARLFLVDNLQEVPEAFQYQRYEIEPTGLIAAPDKVVVCPSARRRGIASALLADRGWQLLGPALPDRRFPGIEFVVATKNYPQSVKQSAHPEIARAA